MNTFDQSLRERYLQLGQTLCDRFFAGKLSAPPKVPTKPVIFAVNHSGMNFPWDCFILFVLLRRLYGASFRLTPLSAPALFTSRVLQPFGLKKFWTLFGEPATFQNFQAVAERGDNILVNPEGVAGIAKGFDNKYQLQRFSTSFVRIALEFNREIVPVYTINGEYLHPAVKLAWLDRLVQKIGLPYIAVGWLTPISALFPLGLYIALPARLRYVVGQSIHVNALAEKPVDQMTSDDLRTLSDRVQTIMQDELNRLVVEHGQKPFAWREAILQFHWRNLPFLWPFLFHHIESEGQSWGDRARGFWTAMTNVMPIVGWPLYLLTILRFRGKHAAQTRLVIPGFTAVSPKILEMKRTQKTARPFERAAFYR
jgi:1-acyl-sn-glycerol-3-phosphate acyltransferase